MIYIGLALLIVAIVICIFWLMPAYTPLIRDPSGQVVQGSIASLEEITLGNAKQWILLRGLDTTKPIILFLHGGPGSSMMGLYKKCAAELEKRFVVVLWDQRGAGKSFAANHPHSDMNINQFISDTCELTEMLCDRFKQKKVFLMGHSWGSVIGVFAVQKRPELFHAFIGIGQVVNMLENEKVSYEWTLEQARKANDQEIVDALTNIGKPPYQRDGWQKKIIKQRKLLGKYGGEIYGSAMGAIPLILKSLICTTEYTLLDKVNFFRGTFSSMTLLWNELMTVNLEERAPDLKVPIFFALGKHDYEAPFSLAERYFNAVNAPRKELVWFENSAHFPNVEETEKFNDFLINRVLKNSDVHREPPKKEVRDVISS
jgi:pimeloyl-ACP methyl ester carboxylesterase